MKRYVVGAAIVALVASLVANAWPAAAVPEGPPIRTSVWTTIHSEIPVDALGEAVLVEGRLHVVSDLATGDSVNVDADQADTRATGVATGRIFCVTGADHASLVAAPEGPPISWQPGFALAPEGPPIRLELELTYDQLGRLTTVRELHAKPTDNSHE